ncbi:MAG: divalent-cation tolerance protein CutA [Candidatus Omnitrophota bacterium]|nr:MAG: divalent-cation tolerance protein CutA [Candidatus Omnitrophota bacterium]
MAMVVLVTIPAKEAKKMANILLEKRVCACVNVIKDIDSYFWWEGKIAQEKESLLVIKTKDSLYGNIKKVVKENHPYDIPEIVGIKIDQINKVYLSWLNVEADAG